MTVEKKKMEKGKEIMDLSVPIRYSNSYDQFKHQLSMDILKEKLSVDNYKKKFHHLLCYEEKEHALQLVKW